MRPSLSQHCSPRVRLLLVCDKMVRCLYSISCRYGIGNPVLKGDKTDARTCILLRGCTYAGGALPQKGIWRAGGPFLQGATKSVSGRALRSPGRKLLRSSRFACGCRSTRSRTSAVRLALLVSSCHHDAPRPLRESVVFTGCLHATSKKSREFCAQTLGRRGV